ncbi:MAG: LexA family transcriptional regulator [Ruminococcus sp.]|nr:LexA family transcriptional regulator [Ruminococcus sp.]
MGFGKLLEEKMKEKGVKQAELAAAVGLPKTTLSSMILRDNTKIEIEKFLDICEYLDCNPEEFYSEFKRTHAVKMPPLFARKYDRLDEFGKDMVNTVLEKEYIRCTAISAAQESVLKIRHSFYKVSAGTGFELGNGDQWETISIPDTPEAHKADFALTIKGDSMEPVYFNEDIVLVREQQAIDLGEIGIFIINGTGYIKKYGGDRLISLNAEYEDIVFSEFDDIRCVGKVIGRI